ncbi:MAG: hypothetical protein QM589_00580 [Thermomicrobiales bacterium]
MQSTSTWRRSLARVIVVLGLLLTVVSPNVLLAQDATETPATEEAPVDMSSESTSAPVETPVETEPPVETIEPPVETFAPPTDVPTDPPVVPETIAPTDPSVEPVDTPEPTIPSVDPATIAPPEPPATLAPTAEPPNATDAAPTDTPSATPTPTVEPSPTPSPTPTERRAAMIVHAAASDSSGLTVDGQSGTAYVTRGGTHTLRVGDLTDANNVVPYYADQYKDAYLGEWYSINHFSAFPTSDCSGEAFYTSIMDPMLPDSSVAVATIVNQTTAYSVRATQYLYMLIEGGGSDFAGYEMVTQASSTCVDVRMFVDTVSLIINGTTASPVTANVIDGLTFTTNQPTGDGWTQSLLESTSGCYSGTEITAAPPGQIINFWMTRPAGTYWYIVRSQTSGDAFYSNCIMVTVEEPEVSPTLTVKGDTFGNFVTGEAVPMYVQGYRPFSKVTGLMYPDSLGCQGTPWVLLDSVTNGSGALEVSPVMLSSQSLSVRFYSYVDGSQVFTNCAPLSYSPTAVQLEVNGSLGPVLAGGGEVHLRATGLPPGSTAYPVLGCDGPVEPDEYGQPIGDDGIFDGYLSDDLPDEFWVRVALAPPSGVSSNCVFVQLVDYEIKPVIQVGGSETPDPVESGAPFEIVGTTFPPNTNATVRAYSGSDDCTGEPVLYGTETDPEGNLSLTLTAGNTGPVSIRADAGEWSSNCLVVPINAAPSTEVPTATATATSTGPDVTVTVSPTSPAVTVTTTVAPTEPATTITPTATGPAVTMTATSTGSTPTATTFPGGPTVTATTIPTDPAVTATAATTTTATTVSTATVPGSTVTVVPTGTNAVSVTPTPTKAPIAGLPVTGGAPTDGSGTSLAILLAALAALVLGMATLVARRGAHR